MTVLIKLWAREMESPPQNSLSESLWYVAVSLAPLCLASGTYFLHGLR